MKYIDYTMPLFKKAIKRNNPKLIHLTKIVVKGYDVFEFWFVTQKAVINYVEPVKRSVEILMDYLSSIDYCLEVRNGDYLEYVKYEKS